MATYSFTKLDTYERCPRIYRMLYGAPGQYEGHQSKWYEAHSVVRKTIARSLRHAITLSNPPILDLDEVCSIFGDVWVETRASGHEAFEDGLSILATFVESFPERTVLGVDMPFTLRLDDSTTIVGLIDRVDERSADDIEVFVYKTGHYFWSRAEVEASLQLLIYNLAAWELFPDAIDIHMTLDNIREGSRITILKDEETLSRGAAYIKALVRQLETDTVWEARLNVDCCYCAGRRNCPAYLDALTNEDLCEVENPSDIEAIAMAREEIALRAKLLGKRKKELEAIIRPHIKDQELVLNGVRYKLVNQRRRTYPILDAIDAVVAATNIPPQEVVAQTTTLDVAKLDELIKSWESNNDQPATRLRSRLAGMASVSTTKKFDARPLPKPKEVAGE